MKTTSGLLIAAFGSNPCTGSLALAQSPQVPNRLHGFKGDTGEPLLPAGAAPAMVGLRHFQTLIATRDRLYVGADGRIHAFAF